MGEGGWEESDGAYLASQFLYKNGCGLHGDAPTALATDVRLGSTSDCIYNVFVLCGLGAPSLGCSYLRSQEDPDRVGQQDDEQDQEGSGAALTDEPRECSQVAIVYTPHL